MRAFTWARARACEAIVRRRLRDALPDVDGIQCDIGRRYDRVMILVCIDAHRMNYHISWDPYFARVSGVIDGLVWGEAVEDLLRQYRYQVRLREQYRVDPAPAIEAPSRLERLLSDSDVFEVSP